MSANVKYILTDIEGTTTSVSFVYDVLFPYFRRHIWKLTQMMGEREVAEAFEQVIDEVYETEGVLLLSNDELIEKLLEWSEADKKITPLKTLQGVLWREAYQQGLIKGQVYADVPKALQRWKQENISMGVFSSGSVEAQRLLFGHSEAGDLSTYFSHYFDTNTGGKRESSTYTMISTLVETDPEHILFLSDVTAELEAAQQAGYQTIQLVRPGTEANWEQTASTFDNIL